MKKLLFIPLIFFMLQTAWSAPNITGVSGSVTNGSTLTISGTAFGTKSTAAPIISSYDNSTSANNFHTGSIGGSWNTRSTTAAAHSGSYQRTSLYQSDYYANCPFESGDYSQLMFDDSNTSTVYYYISLWEYITASTFVCAGSGGNMKDMRIYPDANNSLVSHYISVNEPNQGTASDYGLATEPATECSYLSSITPYQNWYHHEWWIHMTADTSGYAYALIDGKIQCAWTNLIILYNGHSMNAWRLGNVSGDNLSGGSILLDQVYIDNTPAHVFISNRSNITNWLTYSSTAHNETQVASAWSASSITFTVNRGTFGASDTAYLYVVDSTGAISPAYTITFGGAGSNVYNYSVGFATVSVESGVPSGQGGTIYYNTLGFSNKAFQGMHGNGAYFGVSVK